MPYNKYFTESAANTAPTVEIQDESTLPSSWTPGESYGLVVKLLFYFFVVLI